MIPPASEEEDNETKIGYNDNLTRIKEVITTFVTQLRLFDDKAEVISWKTEKDFSFLPQGELPDNVATIAKFFKGFRKRMRVDRRTYLKVGIHTPNSFKQIEEDLEGWADLYSYTIKQCLIQSNDAGYVGWISYTSQYTNTKQWRDYLTRKTGYEWGFKMVPVTTTDKHVKWNQRLKAIGIYVPVHNVEEAKFEISHMLLQDEDTMVATNSYQDRFVYVPPEESIGDNPDTMLAYQAFVNQHQAHTEALCAKLTVHINTNIQTPLNSAIDPRYSLERMILSIMVKDSKNPLFDTPLFHSVDFVPDVSKLWIKEKPEECGTAYVLTFYRPVKKEATEMVVGLGRYIACMYGKDVALEAFSSKHWKATKGWRYSVKTGTFQRPDTKNLISTLAYNQNLSAIRRLQTIALSEQQPPTQPINRQTNNPPQQDSAEASDGRYTDVDALLTPDDPSEDEESKVSGLTDAALQQENEMVQRVKNKSKIQQIPIGNQPVTSVDTVDYNSDVSSITDSSILSSDSSIVASDSSLQSTGDSTTLGAPNKQKKFKFNQDVLASLIKPHMMYNEVKQTVEAYFSHHQNKQTLMKNRVLYKYLEEHFPDEVKRDPSSYEDDTLQDQEIKTNRTTRNTPSDTSKLEALVSTPAAESDNNTPGDLTSPDQQNLNSTADLSTEATTEMNQPASSHNTGSRP